MAARVARVCNDVTCAETLVRGDAVSIVSLEQARRVGCSKTSCPMKLDDEAMPSDIVMPKSYVIIHDTEGVVFDRCHFYIVRWKKERRPPRASRAVKEYFGRATEELQAGVSVPPLRGPWKRVCRVQFLRYQRHGFRKGHEHEIKWDVPVWLYRCAKPLAWRIDMPVDCRVTSAGWISP